MMKFTKSRLASLMIFFLLFANSGLFANETKASITNNSLFGQDETFGIEISFDYPDPVFTGEPFLFNIQIKKPASYQVAGTLKCKFFGGLIPKETNFEAAEYSLENQTATIQWESLSNSNIISFSIPAVSAKVPDGVYPITINFEDKYGFKSTKSVGIYVKNKNESLLPYIKPGEEISPYSVRLQYPGEISYEEKYPLKIILEKGKYTGSLELFVMLPPESKIDIADIDDYQYEAKEGHLFLTKSSLPAGPEFVINCTVLNTSHTTSVYPMAARAKLDHDIELVFAHTIYVGVENSIEPKTVFYDTLNYEDENPALLADYPDSPDKYAELDSLLNVWKESTGATTQSSKIPMGEEIFSDIKADGQTFFAVQIVASEVKLPNLQSRLNAVHVDDPLQVDYDGSIYRYYIGEFPSQAEARETANYLSSNGFEGAFVVKFVNGEKTESYY